MSPFLFFHHYLFRLLFFLSVFLLRVLSTRLIASWFLVWVYLFYSASIQILMMSRVAGLPSNPRARLASSHDSSRGRQVVYQPPSQLDNSRSLRSTSASRARQPPTQSMAKDTRRAQSRPRALPIERPDPRSTRNSSVSSASSSLTSGSSASSFWEKGSVRSYSTSASENNEELESKPIDTSEG